jgi:Icc-related predicted phosphoesterase/uncharacterized protein YprB with RNaseH-like and TPR domain
MNTPKNRLRLMAFSDWRVQNLDDVISFLKTLEDLPDIIVYSGDDVGRFWDGETNHFTKIAEYSKTKKVLAVIGNDDSAETKSILVGEHIHDLHETPFLYNDYCFIGLEGSTSKPGIIVYSEKYVSEHLQNQLRNNVQKKKIIISHPPPYGILDKGIRFAEENEGFHNIGSKSLLDVIENNNIELVVCGHCHSQGGLSQEVNKTLVVNVASHDNSSAEGKFALIDLYSNGEYNLEWHSTTDLIPSESLLNLHGIGHSRNYRLAQAGISTKLDLIMCEDLSKASTLSGLSESFLFKTQLRAKSIEMDTVYKIGSLSLPDNPIFLDIETDIACTKVWLIGLLKDGIFTKFYADSWEEESKILSNLISFLKKHPERCLMSYSCTGFDRNVLIKALERNGLDSSFFLQYIHYDLCQMIRRCFIFPHSNFKLKELGTYLGYDFTHQEFNGFQVALAYHDHISTKKPLETKYFAYNEDDVRSTEYIFRLIEKNEIESETVDIDQNTMKILDLSEYDEETLVSRIRDEFEKYGKIYPRFDKRSGGYTFELRFNAKRIEYLDFLRNAMYKLGFSEGSVHQYKKSKRVYVPFYGKAQAMRFIQVVDPPVSSELREKIDFVKTHSKLKKRGRRLVFDQSERHRE